MTTQTYNERIRAEREKQGLTQEELGALSECKQSYIANIESGLVSISEKKFMKIMGAMGRKVTISVHGENGKIEEIKSNE
jgi:transcriptional regulator with XRE-family HTH domain